MFQVTSIYITYIVEENKQGTKDITIKLDDYSKHTRVHIIANQFEAPDNMFPVIFIA